MTALQKYFQNENYDIQQIKKIEYCVECEDYRRAAHLATIFINGKEKKIAKALSSDEVQFFSPVLIEVYGMRAQAQFRLEEYEDVISGVDTAVTMLKTLCSHLKSDDLHRLNEIHAAILEISGCSATCLEDYERALRDLRASASILRLMGLDISSHDYAQTIENILKTVAEMKAKAPRPHFTPQEARAWTKELQIHQHAPGKKTERRCAACGQTAADQAA